MGGGGGMCVLAPYARGEGGVRHVDTPYPPRQELLILSHTPKTIVGYLICVESKQGLMFCG